eukprot:scaffold12207_cov42-Attheya_sp.AAC.1
MGLGSKLVYDYLLEAMRQVTRVDRCTRESYCKAPEENTIPLDPTQVVRLNVGGSAGVGVGTSDEASIEGASVLNVGRFVGKSVGTSDGAIEGASVLKVGRYEGESVGTSNGAIKGAIEGASETDGSMEGMLDGHVVPTIQAPIGQATAVVALSGVHVHLDANAPA